MFDTDFKIGDLVCSFDGWQGIVTHLNYHNGRLSSVTVKWLNGGLMTHPCTAEDIWLEGQPEKEHPEVKRLRRFKERQDEVNATNTLLLQAYKAEVDKLKKAKITIDWQPEPIDETATIEAFTKEVSRWAEIVQFLDGSQDDEDIKYDLYTRECLHGTLNGLKKQGVEIPAALLETLAKADQHFIENSFVVETPDVEKLKNTLSAEPILLQDLDAFWYEYRWPKYK